MAALSPRGTAAIDWNQDLALPLNELISVQSISVVQTVNADALAKMLAHIMARLPPPQAQKEALAASAAPAASAADDSRSSSPIDDALSAMRERQERLEAQVEELQRAVAAGSASTADPAAAPDNSGRQDTAQDTQPASPAPDNSNSRQARHDEQPVVGALFQDQLRLLQDRVGILEGRSKREEAPSQAESSLPDVKTTGQERQGVTKDSSDLSDINERLAALEAKLRQSESAAPVPSVAASVAAQTATHRAPDEDVRHQLRDVSSRLAALEAKARESPAAPLTATTSIAVPRPAAADSHLLHDQLASKADRSQLDALAKRFGDRVDALDSALAQALRRMAEASMSVGRSAPAAEPTATAPPPAISTAASDAAVSSPTQDAGSSTAEVLGRVFDIETSIQDMSTLLQRLQECLADQGRALEDLGGQIADKADRSALDRIASAALAGGMPATLGARLPEGALDTNASSTAALQALLDDKVSKAELEALRQQVLKASADKQAFPVNRTPSSTAQAVAQRPSPAATTGPIQAAGHIAASRAELDALAQQVAGMLANLTELRKLVSGLPVPPRSQGDDVQRGPDDATEIDQPSSTADAFAAAAAGDLQTLRDQLDWVAHAACIMAVGGALPHENDGKESPHPQGATARLIKMLGNPLGGVTHKMDWFDPDALNKLSTKLGMMEAASGRPNTPGSLMQGGQGPAGPGMRDLELQLRRLSKDVRALMEGRAPTGNSNRTPNSDHAMISGKPLLGYRCLGCDRPLERLHERPAPHVPTSQMPVRVAGSSDAANRAAMMRAPVVGLPAAPGTDGSVMPAQQQQQQQQQPVTNKAPLTKLPFDPSQRGPQAWYDATQKPLAADALPSADVGPKLPPGGWRSSTPGGKPGGASTLLPEIPLTPTGAKQRNVPSTALSQPGAKAPADVEDHLQVHLGLGLG